MSVADVSMNTVLLALLNLLVGVIGAYLRTAMRDLDRRLQSIERTHEAHVSWHMNRGEGPR